MKVVSLKSILKASHKMYIYCSNHPIVMDNQYVYALYRMMSHYKEMPFNIMLLKPIDFVEFTSHHVYLSALPI